METSLFPSCFLLLSPLFFLLLLPSASHAQTTTQTYMNLTRSGTKLSSSGPNSFLTSRLGDFAFGFSAYPSNESLFLLAIWFNAASPRHIIWFANNEEKDPILATKDSTLSLNQDGSLILQRPDQPLIRIIDMPDADHATLLDSGNFVICKTYVCDDSSPPLWESFNYPTDTIVPGQVLNSSKELWSKLTDSNFSRGRFILIVQNDNNTVIYPVVGSIEDRYTPIWAAVAHDGSPYCYQLVFYPNGSLICLNNPKVNITSSPTLSPRDYYLHATLDPDGLFRMYASKRNNSVGWEVTGMNLADGCLMWGSGSGGGGVCGVNGLCNTKSMNQTRLDCICPQNYSYVDSGNIYMGCKPDLDVHQYCGAAHEPTEVNLIEFNHTDWQSEDYEWYKSFSEQQCRQNCLQDCYCVVAVYRSQGDGRGCHKKSQPLQFGIFNETDDAKVFIKVPISKPKNVGRDLFLVGSAILLGAASILLVIVVFLVARIRRGSMKSTNMLWPNLKEFTYKEIKRATGNFNEELGRGSFGVVYKGFLRSDPHTDIAVKKLELLNQGEREFETEVRSIGQSHHKNLVKLIGFCNEGSNRMLVYEYMGKGSLEKFIEVGDEMRSWHTRANVSLETAKGLQYLHEGRNSPVIHCDIKPQNILLDDKFVAKISDFGVAKLLGTGRTHTSTIQRYGTPGYVAPEIYDFALNITPKVDVYSFGVLLLEIIFRKVGIAQQVIRDIKAAGNIIQAVVEQLKQKLVTDLGDAEDEANIQSMQKFTEVAVSCVQEDPSVRPSMCDVVYLLTHAIPKSSPTDTMPTPESSSTMPMPRQLRSLNIEQMQPMRY